MNSSDLPKDINPAAPSSGRGIRIILSIVASALLMSLMGLTVVDVIGRYLLNAPLKGSTELSELLLVAIVFLGLPAVCLDGGHVTVDLVTNALPQTIETPRLFVVGIVSTGVLALISWRLWAYGTQVGSYHLVTNSLRLPVSPVVWFCAALTALSSFITLALTLSATFKRTS